MLKAKELCLANDVKRIKWEVEQDNYRAIQFYERLGADFDIKGIFKWDVSS